MDMPEPGRPYPPPTAATGDGHLFSVPLSRTRNSYSNLSHFLKFNLLLLLLLLNILLLHLIKLLILLPLCCSSLVASLVTPQLSRDYISAAVRASLAEDDINNPVEICRTRERYIRGEYFVYRVATNKG